MCFSGGSVVKNLPANVGEMSSILGLGRSPVAGNSNPLQYSCLGNPMRRAWWAIVHEITELDTTKQLRMHIYVHIYIYIYIYIHTHTYTHTHTHIPTLSHIVHYRVLSRIPRAVYLRVSQPQCYCHFGLKNSLLQCCPSHHGMFSSIPGLLLSRSRWQPASFLWGQDTHFWQPKKCHQILPCIPWGQNCSLLRTIDLF